MFENLLHQDSVVSRLRHDRLNNAVPPAILFTGPPMSGKLTAALELARVLSCEEEAAWNCPCGHCRSHRALAHTRTVLTGPRTLTPEISAAVGVLRRDTTDTSRFLLVRSARKLLRRFDPFLWEGDDKKLVKTRPVMERLAETLDILLPGRPLPEGKKFEKLLDTLVDDCAAVQDVLPGILPVAQVRHITLWAVHSSGSDHKTVILDAADRMPDASRNALLKFLEEPPPDTTVILITDRKSMLLPTIISRLREYAFRIRRPSEEAEVLRRVFREDQGRWGGLVDYFQAWRTGPSERMRETAAQFLSHAASGEPFVPDEAKEIREQQDLVVFLEAVSAELRNRWNSTDYPDHKKSLDEMKYLRDARMRAESLNLPVPLLLRGLYIAMGPGA
jgi:DNA polymerase-3 subunit gamma/tau